MWPVLLKVCLAATTLPRPSATLQLRYSTTFTSGEVVYFAMGIDEDGHGQILGFYVGGQESANGWREVLKDLYDRGSRKSCWECLMDCQNSMQRSVLKKRVVCPVKLSYLSYFFDLYPLILDFYTTRKCFH